MSIVRMAGAVIAGALGASLASFLSVVAERGPRGEGVTGRSHCVCGEAIRARDNIPIIGFLARRGRARCCGARIPRWYVVAEIAGAVLGVGASLLATT